MTYPSLALAVVDSGDSTEIMRNEVLQFAQDDHPFRRIYATMLWWKGCPHVHDRAEFERNMARMRTARLRIRILDLEPW